MTLPLIPLYQRDVALYIHIPFCSHKCHYCAFAVVTDSTQKEEYLAALHKELHARLEDAIKHDRHIRTIYFGGGTPSLLAPHEIEAMLHVIYSHIPPSDVVEITIEMNPEDVTDSVMGALQALGVSRVSMGIQTFSEKVLRKHNRAHTAELARAAMGVLAQRQRRWSADLILGLPGSKPEDTQKDVREVLSYGPSHISVYMYTAHKNSVAATLMKSELPKDQALADAFERVQQVLSHEEYVHYEISNWAKQDHTCEHNRMYWRGMEYIGVGLAASSYMYDTLIENKKNILLYMQDPLTPASRTSIGTPSQRHTYMLLTGTRLAEGVAVDTFMPFSTDEQQRTFLHKIRSLQEQGLLQASDTHIILSAQGKLFHNFVVEELGRFL